MGKPIAYREESMAAFIDMSAVPGVSTAAKKVTEAAPKESMDNAEWSPWGSNNLFPQEMIADIESTGILNAIIDGKARFAICEGMVPAIVERDESGKKVVKEWVNDPEIEKFLEMNNHFFQAFGWMKDLLGFANGACQIMLTKDFKKIATFKRLDISKTRIEKKTAKNGYEAKKVFISSDWAKATGKADDKTVKSIALLDMNNPLEDLAEKAGKKVPEHVMLFNYPGWDKDYYSIPLWYAAYKWVKIAQGVPEMKAALFQNSMRLKYIVTIYPDYWTDAYPDQWDTFTPEVKEAKREELFDQINEYLVGAKNAHKSLFVDGFRDKISGNQWANIEIKPIEDNTKQGEYLPDSAAANSEIAFSMLFNPAIIGASLPSGPYTNSQGGSNVRESVLMQIIMHELERKMIGRVMNLIKYYNGWDIKHPGLEFIIPATALTTLDTGASSKPIMTGGVEPKKENDNGTGNND